MDTYSIKECFYSIQGEGHRTGTAGVFLRFAGCNLQCVDATTFNRPLVGKEVDAGFFCDTDFAKGEKLTKEEVVAKVRTADVGRSQWVIFTGGEPALQVDMALIQAFHAADFKIAMETNGTIPIPYWALIAWLSCSPKKGTKVVISRADEVRCVVKHGQEPDAQGVRASHYFVSPATTAPPVTRIQNFRGMVEDFDEGAMFWSVEWCKSHPSWRISLQIHKVLNVQ